MSYHRFTNLHELLHGDLSRKVNKGVISKDFENKSCNCNTSSTSSGMCTYKGMCRQYCVVYKVMCKFCNAICIRNTQQSLKKKMEGHFLDVQKLITEGMILDSFTKHFAQHFDSEPSWKKLCDNMKSEILSKLNPIGVMKTFGSRNCSLCMNECLTIRKWIRKKQKKLINSCSEIYGACQHKTSFHRFTQH